MNRVEDSELSMVSWIWAPELLVPVCPERSIYECMISYSLRLCPVLAAEELEGFQGRRERGEEDSSTRNQSVCKRPEGRHTTQLT